MGWLTQVHPIIVKKLWQVSFHKLTNICGGWYWIILTLRNGNQRITTTYLSEKKLNRPILFKNYRVTFIWKTTIWSKYLSCHTLLLIVESYVKPFQYKVINSILYTNTKLYKIGFRTNDLCTFCDSQPESLTHLFYHCSRSKQFWSEFELYCCLISNQRICLCLENELFGILTENACPLLQLLNYFIIIGKLYLWDCRSKQIFPNIYEFRVKIIAKYETEEKISNKEFFKIKWILTPYLS